MFSVSVFNTQSNLTQCAVQLLLSACMHRCATNPLGTSLFPASDLIICA